MKTGCALRSRTDWLDLDEDETEKNLVEETGLPLLQRFHDWIGNWARADQCPPQFSDPQWLVWLILAGRGSGKTRAGAEWVRMRVFGRWPEGAEPARRIALVGPTLGEARSVMVEGVSGLLSIHPDYERPDFEPSLRRLIWPNGAVAQLFSAEEPDSLRGPQFDTAWCDEAAKWRYGLETWRMLQFGMRLGACPRQVVTTTPRPGPLLKELMSARTTCVTRARTQDNADFLSVPFLDAIVAQYEGTRLGRQELDAEILEDNPHAFWQRDQIDRCRVDKTPELRRVVVAIDPPATSAPGSSSCGIVCAGLDSTGRGIVLEDATLDQARPLEWAREAIRLYEKHEADRLVAEVNQGGEMVETVLRQIEASIPVRKVRATRGKQVRAEPVAALYEQGRVSHLGALPQLKWGVGGYVGGRSLEKIAGAVLHNNEKAPKGGGFRRKFIRKRIM